MRCLSCRKFSLDVICDRCHMQLLKPTVSTRKAGTLDVISLFGYRTVAPFLLRKHGPVGYRLYRYFARKQIAPFLEAFAEGIDERVWLVGVDEYPASGYSHTAILTRYGRVEKMPNLPGALVARNRVNYAGKTLRYRLENPRDFLYRGPSGIRAVLIDDIVTTGVTLQEAHSLLRRSGVEVVFALTLADARE